MRISKTYPLLLLTMLLWAPSAMAQNGEGLGYRSVHDWTVQIGSARYGVWEKTYSFNGRQPETITFVYVGRPWFEVRIPAIWVVTVALTIGAVPLVFLLMRRGKKSGTDEMATSHALQRNASAERCGAGGKDLLVVTGQ